MINFHAPARERRGEPESPPLCVNPACRKPRRERKDSPGNFTGAHGWCEPCAKRWYAAGRPEDGPPAPMSHAERCALANAARKAAVAARAGEYARLRNARNTPAQAARRLGLTADTGQEYEAAYQIAAMEAA